MAIRFSNSVEAALTQAAGQHDIELNFMRAVCHIESSGDPKCVTGNYKGLFQLSDAEFRTHASAKASVFDPSANASAAARKWKADIAHFTKRAGRPPIAAELYMVHQQGVSGTLAHLDHPAQPAWQSMHGTTEGKQRGAAWAKRAIWNNLPDSAKKQFGSVDNVSSEQFVGWWRDRFARAINEVA